MTVNRKYESAGTFSCECQTWQIDHPAEKRKGQTAKPFGEEEASIFQTWLGAFTRNPGIIKTPQQGWGRTARRWYLRHEQTRNVLASGLQNMPTRVCVCVYIPQSLRRRNKQSSFKNGQKAWTDFHSKGNTNINIWEIPASLVTKEMQRNHN